MKNQQEIKENKLNLLNSSVIVNFIILIDIYIIGQRFGFLDKISIFSVTITATFVIMVFYLLSWRKIKIKEKGIEIKSIFKIGTPLFIPYEDINNIEYTGYAIIIDFDELSNKIKLDLIYAYWVEFITMSLSSKEVTDILKAIEKRKDRKIDNNPGLSW